MQIVCIHYNCCGYVWKVIFLFLPLSSKYNYRESGPFLVVAINHLRFLYDIPQMPHCPLFDRLVYGGCFIICASVRARDVLPLLSIKVQVVTTVWHSLSACGFADLAPKQLGSIGCHIQPVKDGRARDECCPPTTTTPLSVL